VLRFIRTGRKDVGDEAPTGLPGFDDFGLGSLPMSERMTPILESIWDEQGRAFTSRIGLDPDSWEVTNPRTQEAINKAALDFCQATNETTSLELGEALRQTRAALSSGLITQGESVADLTKRIGQIFDGAETWRARRIAASEASRATHAAQEMAGSESGVVTGWRWLLSEDACPLCQTVARRVPAVRLGQPFAVVGDSPVYSVVRHPPLHPGCQCALEPVLDIDRQPQWAATLDQPQPEEQDHEGGEAPAPKQPKPAAAQKPTPAPKVKPVDPIKARLDAWKEGDAKIAALQKLGENLGEDARMQWAQRSYDALDKLDAYTASLKPGDKRKKAVREKLKELTDARVEARGWAFRHDDKVREEVGKIVKAEKPVAYNFKDATSSDKLKTSLKDGGDWLSPLINDLEQRHQVFGLDITAESPTGLTRANGGHGTIRLSPNTPARTVVHEIGHCLEDQIRGVGQAGKDFREYRIRGQEQKKFKDLFPGHGYEDHEEGADDEFGKYFSTSSSEGRFADSSAWYVGKHYSSRSEIISMGLEALYVDGVRFAQKDPEYCKFILGILSGDLR
jgi:hypothetical protein